MAVILEKQTRVQRPAASCGVWLSGAFCPLDSRSGSLDKPGRLSWPWKRLKGQGGVGSWDGKEPQLQEEGGWPAVHPATGASGKQVTPGHLSGCGRTLTSLSPCHPSMPQVPGERSAPTEADEKAAHGFTASFSKHSSTLSPCAGWPGVKTQRRLNRCS